MRRPRPGPSLGLSALFLAFFATAFYSARDLPPTARVFPIYMVGCAAVVALAQVMIDIWRPMRSDATGTDLAVQDEHTLPQAMRLASAEFGAIGGLLAGTWLLGPLIALPVYVAASYRFRAHRPWWETAVVTLAFFVGMSLLFEYLLTISWPRGLVPGPQQWLLGLLRQVPLY